jgi:hypothetical protein
MKLLRKYATFVLAIVLMVSLMFAIGAFSQVTSGAVAKPQGTTTTTVCVPEQFTNYWNGVNGAENNVTGAGLHWVLGGNGYTGPITLHIVYSDWSAADFAGEIHANGSMYADSVGKPGLKVKFAWITYWACEKSDHKLTISHVLETTTTTTEKCTTTTTEQETTTTTEEETTTTTEEETTTTTEEETTTTTEEETTTTTEKETTTTTDPGTTTTTQPQTTTTEPEPTTVTLIQTDDGAVSGLGMGAYTLIVFAALLLGSATIVAVKRR